MIWLYQEVSDFSHIFNVKDHGQALIADFKKHEADLRQESDRSKRDLSFILWFSSTSPSADAHIGSKNSAFGFIVNILGGHSAITSETEWPMVSWKSIIAANPGMIVIVSLNRNRWALDRAEEKVKFLKSDSVVSRLEAVKKGYIMVTDGQAVNPAIRILYDTE